MANTNGQSNERLKNNEQLKEVGSWRARKFIKRWSGFRCRRRLHVWNDFFRIQLPWTFIHVDVFNGRIDGRNPRVRWSPRNRLKIGSEFQSHDLSFCGYPIWKVLVEFKLSSKPGRVGFRPLKIFVAIWKTRFPCIQSIEVWVCLLE